MCLTCVNIIQAGHRFLWFQSSGGRGTRLRSSWLCLVNSEAEASLCYLILFPYYNPLMAFGVWKYSMNIANGISIWCSVGYLWVVYNQHGVETAFRNVTLLHSIDWSINIEIKVYASCESHKHSWVISSFQKQEGPKKKNDCEKCNKVYMRTRWDL